MRAVLMAGGHGTRLRPALAPTINKHLYPVGGKPLILWPIKTLAEMGITEALVILNGDNPQLILETLGSGNEYGLELWYRYNRETEGASVGRHLKQAGSFVKDEPFILMLADSVFLTTPSKPESEDTTISWVMQKDDEWDDMNKYASLPGSSGLIQTGLWMFTKSIFDAIQTLEHLETLRIRDLVSYLAKNDSLIHQKVPDRSFIDCGTPAAISKINTMHNLGPPE